MGFTVGRENVTTRDIELLALPTGTRLHPGADVVIALRGLRNPCMQLDTFQPGLMAALQDHTESGRRFARPQQKPT